MAKDTGIVSIHGKQGYSVSKCGKVFGPKGELNAGIGKNGYKVVMLGRGDCRYVHQIVAEHFIGPAPSKMVVMHIDEDKKNNSAENLKYGTQSENMKAAVNHNPDAWLHRAVLSRDEARHIKTLDLSEYGSCTRIAKEYGVHPNTILDIKHGRTWKNA